MYWFTSDTHFGHANIIKYNKRPFSSVEDMDSTIIQNINNVVSKNDTLFHLGDWSFGPKKDLNNAKKYLDQIICKSIIIIPGNHDPHHSNMKPRDDWAKLFTGCFPYYYLKIKERGIEIFMFHYCCTVWNKSHWGSWHLFGHSHGNLDVPGKPSLDVGVDANNFKPLSLDDVERKIALKIREQ